MYRVAADTNDVEPARSAARRGFSLPVEALLAAADERTKLLWLCSPNNPTGNAFPEGEIERLLAGFDGMVVLDEAYIDFADGPGFLPRLAEFPNLIVLQTCSKAWGMAGLRLGLAFASEPVAELFARVKYPYNINTLAQEAASERLAWDIAGQTALIRRERAAVAEALAGAACIERVYPLRGQLPAGTHAGSGPSLRHPDRGGHHRPQPLAHPGCAGCLRITVGTPGENARLIETVKNFRP